MSYQDFELRVSERAHPLGCFFLPVLSTHSATQVITSVKVSPNLLGIYTSYVYYIAFIKLMCPLLFFFLAEPMAYAISKARDQTCTTAVTNPDPSPTAPPWNFSPPLKYEFLKGRGFVIL